MSFSMKTSMINYWFQDVRLWTKSIEIRAFVKYLIVIKLKRLVITPIFFWFYLTASFKASTCLNVLWKIDICTSHMSVCLTVDWRFESRFTTSPDEGRRFDVLLLPSSLLWPSTEGIIRTDSWSTTGVKSIRTSAFLARPAAQCFSNVKTHKKPNGPP